MRDKIKSRAYFLRRLHETWNDIEEWNQIILENHAQEKVTNKSLGFLQLAVYYRNLFYQSYSLGKNINDIYFYYEQWLSFYCTICEEDTGIDIAIDLFSLAVLYKDKVEETSPYLLKMMENPNFNDGMLNLCLEYLGLKSGDNKICRIGYLNKLINDKEYREHKLGYAMKHWYGNQSETGWFDTHKSEHNLYDGYWAFDIGAIVKIFNLNDDEIKDDKYYPYALVHFENEDTIDEEDTPLDINELMEKEGYTPIKDKENTLDDNVYVFQGDNDKTMIMVTAIPNDEGDIQLGKNENGHLELSSEWLDDITNKLPDTSIIKQKIETAREQGELQKLVFFIDPDTAEMKIIPVEFEDENKKKDSIKSKLKRFFGMKN